MNACLPQKNFIFILNSLKKQFTILALLVFFLAQFGKTIKYCFCTMAVYQQTGSTACDCEKQLSADVQKENAGKHTSPHAATAQSGTEELFHLPLQADCIPPPGTTPNWWPPSGAASLYCIFGKAVFHPPLQVV
jgi:hypothetical protein